MAANLLAWGAVALSALPVANAHMNLKHPVPFDQTQLKQDRSPLESTQYPCKFQTYSITERTKLAVGSSYTMDFYPGDDAEVAEIGSTTGAAVHDGGSCQLSITLDKEPTAKSVFKVFHSIEGGCPGLNNQAATFQYSLPASIPNGDVTFAWTWFPVSSQIPEMYMNCAPVTVTGGADDESAFNELPDIFVGNIGFTSFSEGLGAVSSLLSSTVSQASLLEAGTIPSCLAEGEAVLQFPDAGDSLDSAAGQWPLKKPSGQCSAGSRKASLGSSAAPASTAESTTQAATTSTAAATSAATSVAGIFAEAPSSAAAVAETSTFVSATTFMTTTKPTTAAAVAPSAAAPAASSSNASGLCTSANDGQVVCNGTSQFGLCNAGSVVWQDVSAGMVCKDGKVVGAQ
ncbi:hypothetical protein GTA08_BOTSDO09030 [Neofusicoccum parvum]|uniref:Uncharacterized protein n=1 Tax=Neofusicoccum parvum TaxID=310453 RepID=A0ACB5SNW4_9PEZI|nr:hypothetical protein GTA08_BOTSDO09030 [Neofusicoccum parvum]